MTESEAIEKLEAHIECESKRSSIEGCNEGCIDCELAYLQGTSKEHIESVKLAIQALEKAMKNLDKTNFSDGYNRAIDDFLKEADATFPMQSDGTAVLRRLEKIADKLKGGGSSE